MSTNAIRMTAGQHAQLKAHLFPGDGFEAVALGLCGRLSHQEGHVLCLHSLLPIPHDQCSERTGLRVSWPTELGQDLFALAARKSMAVIKIHSHPGFYDRFSEVDDESDLNLFQSLHSWTDDGLPHASAVMLSDGSMFGRFIDDEGKFSPVSQISIAGDDIEHFFISKTDVIGEAQLRTRQAFGEGTTALLSQLRIGVVGCSGTGSWIVEQLARLGVGHLVLVDPDLVEAKNLNRIVGSTLDDVGKPKVEVLKAMILRYSTCRKVTAIANDLFSQEVGTELGACDILFGCMDSIEGRDRLNRLATFYSVPYFDLGIRLDADGQGGISSISGAVHYLLPGGSSLLSRGVYSAQALADESLRRSHPDQYAARVKEGYIKGAKVDSPAVVSVNGFCATMAVNEMLARIHPFRGDPNSGQRWQQFDLVNSYWQQREDGPACPLLAKMAGRGDMKPYLNVTFFG